MGSDKPMPKSRLKDFAFNFKTAVAHAVFNKVRPILAQCYPQFLWIKNDLSDKSCIALKRFSLPLPRLVFGRRLRR
jgi:hypothetical protein